MSEPVSLARPRALKEGDRVAVLCVSSPVEPEALNAGLDALRFAGLDPVTYPSAHDPGTMRPYLAGDDAMRAGDLRSALTEPGIAGILFARGGYGAQRTLEAMDWDGLGPETGMPPKVLAGYSDVTAVLEAVAEPDPDQRGLGQAPALADRNPGVEQAVGHVVQRRHAPGQVELLEDHAQPVRPQPGEAPVGQALDGLAGDAYRAGTRPVQGGGQVEQRGLAGPGRPEDGHQFTGIDGEGDAPQRLHRRGARVDLADVAQFQDGAHRAGTSTCWPAVSCPVTSTSPVVSS